MHGEMMNATPVDKAAVKRFVRDLGCTCPESVFDSIEYEPNVDNGPGGQPARARLLIGERLLIYVLDRSPDLPSTLAHIVAAARAERDRSGYSRVRLVVIGVDPDTEHGHALGARFESAHRDERTHLHILVGSELPF